MDSTKLGGDFSHLPFSPMVHDHTKGEKSIVLEPRTHVSLLGVVMECQGKVESGKICFHEYHAFRDVAIFIMVRLEWGCRET